MQKQTYNCSTGQMTESAISQEEIDAIPTVDPNAIIMEQILAIEGTITQRRIREAVLGTDAGWLSDREDEIAALRVQLV